MKEQLEYRMYGLVPYNISPIQQAIQYGHALQEYNNDYFARSEEFTQWRTKDKTFIILNGGTTNNTPSIVTGEPFGTLNQHADTLLRNNVKTAEFYEPDLGDQLTAVVFLVDERVWNTEKYPNFSELSEKQCYYYYSGRSGNVLYDEWIESVGGKHNVWLRYFLSQFKLA